jgi:hypothetical protein
MLSLSSIYYLFLQASRNEIAFFDELSSAKNGIKHAYQRSMKNCGLAVDIPTPQARLSINLTGLLGPFDKYSLPFLLQRARRGFFAYLYNYYS